MKLFSILYLIGAAFTIYECLICLLKYLKTNEEIYKLYGLGSFALSVALLLIAFKHSIPISSNVVMVLFFIIGFAGISIRTKARRLSPNYQPPAQKSSPIVLNIIIVMVFLFLAPLVYGIIQNYFLFNSGQVIHATVTDNVKLRTPDRYGSFDCIIYQFSKNGKLIRQNATVKSVLQGKRAEEFKRGDKIDILYFNGLSVIKDNYKQNLKPGLYLILGFLAIFIWVIYKRINLVKE